MPTDVYLTKTQVEDLFFSITALLYGYDVKNEDQTLAAAAMAAATLEIQMSWPTAGAPGWGITDNRTFLQVLYENDDYSQQRYYTYTNKKDSSGNLISPLTANQEMAMTNVLRVNWVVYGPTSYDRAFTLWSRIYDPSVTLWTSKNKIYLIPNLQAPKRSPELFAAQWWERVDLNAQFNATVIINTDAPFIQSVDISIGGDTPKTLVPGTINIVTDIPYLESEYGTAGNYASIL